jgi:hypothetical protein
MRRNTGYEIGEQVVCSPRGEEFYLKETPSGITNYELPFRKDEIGMVLACIRVTDQVWKLEILTSRGVRGWIPSVYVEGVE